MKWKSLNAAYFFLLFINRKYPAPLMLCSIDGFDLIDDPSSCPVERNALKEFYVSAKGGEWTVSTYWMDPHIGHCEWHGINCNGGNNTIKLELDNNGLSGKLSPYISNLSFIEVLDLNDNDIKVIRIMLLHMLSSRSILIIFSSPRVHSNRAPFHPK